MIRFSRFFILMFFVLWHSIAASNEVSVDTILAAKKAPDGVVFEIVSGNADLLSELLGDLKKDIDRLHKRFKGLPIAIVTHGTEQFSLMKKNAKNAPEAHNLVKKLVAESDVDVHVCGTHAEWYGYSAEDFPDYVDVAAAGPSQIKDYVALGYQLIVLP